MTHSLNVELAEFTTANGLACPMSPLKGSQSINLLPYLANWASEDEGDSLSGRATPVRSLSRASSEAGYGIELAEVVVDESALEEVPLHSGRNTPAEAERRGALQEVISPATQEDDERIDTYGALLFGIILIGLGCPYAGVALLALLVLHFLLNRYCASYRAKVEVLTERVARVFHSHIE